MSRDDPKMHRSRRHTRRRLTYRLIHKLARDTDGSVSFEAIWGMLFVGVLLVIGLFLFQITKTGGSGSIDNRTIGRNAAINESCTASGLTPGLSQTIGIRDDSRIEVRCDNTVNSESRMDEPDRFWAALQREGNAHFADFNANQKDHGTINAVLSQQETSFARDFAVGDEVLASPGLRYGNSTLTPVGETWRFDATPWAEGHDRVVWEKLSTSQRELFPKVYPSALEPPSNDDPCERVMKQHEAFHNTGPISLTGNSGSLFGGDEEPGIGVAYEIAKDEGSLFDSQTGTALSNSDKCVRDRWFYYENSLSLGLSDDGIGIPFTKLEIPLPSIKGDFEAGIFKKEVIEAFDSGALVTQTTDIGMVGAELEAGFDDGGLEFEAEAAGNLSNYAYEACQGAGAGSAGCLRASVGVGNVKAEAELEIFGDDGFEFDASAGANVAEGRLGGSGVLDLNDLGTAGRAITGLVGDTKIIVDGQGTVGVLGGQIATPPVSGGKIKSTSVGITGSAEGSISIQNKTLEEFPETLGNKVLEAFDAPFDTPLPPAEFRRFDAAACDQLTGAGSCSRADVVQVMQNELGSEFNVSELNNAEVQATTTLSEDIATIVDALASEAETFADDPVLYTQYLLEEVEALGLSKEESQLVVSVLLDLTPIVGDVKGAAQTVTGTDLVTGEELSRLQEGAFTTVGVAASIFTGGVGGSIVRGASKSKKIAKASKAIGALAENITRVTGKVGSRVRAAKGADEVAAISNRDSVPDSWRQISGIGAQIRTPRNFKSYRTPDGDIVHLSPNGLQYGPDPTFGNRVDHVLDHTVPNPNKPKHSVFNAQGEDALYLVDEAWLKRGAAEANDPGAFVVDMGRPVGTAGETSIRVIVKSGTSEVITAYPY